jgi:D-alanine--poly(phosphoribitol) ligase subunit 2
MQTDIQARVLKLVEAATFKKVDLDEPLLDSGLVDSISAVDLALQMEAEFGIEMPAIKIREHMMTTRSLVSYVTKTHH